MTPIDSLAKKEFNNQIPQKDSLTNETQDSLSVNDTTGDIKPVMSIEDKETQLGIKISKDALPETVKTSAEDSLVINIDSSIFHLFGKAKVNYSDIEINSGMMTYRQKSNTMTAEPIRDTADKIISFQQFVQGDQTFVFDTLKYNFKSKRALVRNAHSQYGEGFVISEQVKRNSDESIFGLGNIYTTCDLPHPHFGIRAKKIKIIPGKMIASGPANLIIQDVPTPLVLPFGVFPIKQSQTSGFILPSYTLEDRRGLGLTGGGYYFPINDYLGVITQFDVFSKGSWGASAIANYNKRYQYSGNFNLRYLKSVFGEPTDPDGQISKDFRVEWSHTVDGKARPGTHFGASVNFGTSSYNYLNGGDIPQALSNEYSSSISYSKNWIGKPYSFTAALRHSQNTQSHQVSITAPELNFNLGQFSPFQRKNMIGNPRWYEKISVTYSVAARNTWDFYDSTLNINNININDFNNAIKHTANVSANYNVLKYFNWSFNIPYNEYWNTKQTFNRYNPITQKVDTTVNNGFFATRDFMASTSLSTRIYGMKMFKKGKIMGIRHVLSPSVGINYQPGFANAPFNYMYGETNEKGEVNYLSPYAYTPFGGPTNPNNVGSMSFSLGNTLQMKVRGDDSTGNKNISLIDGLSINGAYNFFADSNKLSNISMSFKTSILNKINISANASLDPYQYEGRSRTARYLAESGGGLAKISYGNLSTGLSFQGKQKENDKLDKAKEENEKVARLLNNDGYDDYYDFNIPWNLSVNGGVGLNRLRRDDKADSITFTPNLVFDGGFNLTERWKVNFSSALEFTGFSKIKLGTTNISINRDLHCWQMSLNLVPFGYYRSFMFTLQVKASVLQDLKLTRRKSYQDNF